MKSNYRISVKYQPKPQFHIPGCTKSIQKQLNKISVFPSSANKILIKFPMRPTCTSLTMTILLSHRNESFQKNIKYLVIKVSWFMKTDPTLKILTADHSQQNHNEFYLFKTSYMSQMKRAIDTQHTHLLKFTKRNGFAALQVSYILLPHRFWRDNKTTFCSIIR